MTERIDDLMDGLVRGILELREAERKPYALPFPTPYLTLAVTREDSLGERTSGERSSESSSPRPQLRLVGGPS